MLVKAIFRSLVVVATGSRAGRTQTKFYEAHTGTNFQEFVVDGLPQIPYYKISTTNSRRLYYKFETLPKNL